MLAVPFENLDVQLGVAIDTGVEAAWQKIVVEGRGGWCFEQNGVFGAVLADLGFDVTRIAAGVMQHERGDSAFGNHLALRVDIDGQRWLADVGFGGSLLCALPMRPGEYDSVPYRVRLEPLGDDGLRFVEQAPGNKPFSYDFFDRLADETLLDVQCDRLQSAPDSGFVRRLVVQRRGEDRHSVLRGPVFREVSPSGAREQTIDSLAEFSDVLNGLLERRVAEIHRLWALADQQRD